MGHAQPVNRLGFDAYLEWEAMQPDKHEFLAGEVFAMTGARRAHVTVAGNLFAALRAHVRGGPCRAYISDMKVRVATADASFYPDVVVTCDPRDHVSEQYLEHPTVVVEVLSDATAAFDRGEKFAAYRRLASLREYVIVDMDSRRIECFRRDSTDHWVLYEFNETVANEACELTSLGVSIPLAAIFEDVEPLEASSATL